MNLSAHSSSRFDGRRNASLHAQQRGVSPPYVNCGVYIGMRRETAVRSKTDALAVLAKILTPEVPALLKSEIVNQPAHARVVPERSILLCSRFELVTESSKHAEIVS